MKRLLIALGLLSVLFGCGGGGGGGSSNPLVTMLGIQMNAINNRNINGLMGTVSLSYLDDCETWTDYRNGWVGIFQQYPGFVVTLSNIQVHASSIDTQNGIGWVDATVTITENSNGVITSYPFSGTSWFALESGSWKEIGNGTCPDTAMVGGKPKQLR